MRCVVRMAQFSIKEVGRLQNLNTPSSSLRKIFRGGVFSLKNAYGKTCGNLLSARNKEIAIWPEVVFNFRLHGSDSQRPVRMSYTC